MANTFALQWTNSPAFDTLDSQAVESAAGEDIAWSFTPDTGTTDVSAWTIQFDVAPSDNRNPVITVANGSITKGMTGAISFSTLKAVTEVLPSRSYYWELIRTDSGHRKVLAFGHWTVVGSPSLLPGVVIGPTIIPLAKGGTGSDLSASGPGVLIQAAALANVTTLTGDLANTTLYLRKDLTWQLPTGSVPGTVTDVSVVTANGVSGTVATSTTTPAITISLGAITPSSVNGIPITGATSPTLLVTGPTSISGTNTGDQTNISGNAATVSVIDAGADTSCWVLFATSQTGPQSPVTNSNITFNAATGVLSVPTAAPGTNTTQVATCAFVIANIGVPTTITVANEATDTTCFPAFFTAATGDLGPKSNAALTFNSATANLGCTTFTGALVGNASTATLASTVTTNANLTGPITSVGNATSIASQTGTGTKFVVDTAPTIATSLQVTAAASTVGLTLKLNATPGDALQVNSSSGSGGDRFKIDGSGNVFCPVKVGIGSSTSFTKELHVGSSGSSVEIRMEVPTTNTNFCQLSFGTPSLAFGAIRHVIDNTGTGATSLRLYGFNGSVLTEAIRVNDITCDIVVAVGKMKLAAPGTTSASLNFPVSAAPTSPADGDVWREDNTNTGLKVRINGVTKTITVS